MKQNTAAASAPPNDAAGSTPTADASRPSDNSTPEATTVNDLANELAGEAPEPQPHAIEQAQAEAVAQQGRDSNGIDFNPAIHAANADGSPKKTVKGAFAMKRGRPAGKATGAQPAAKVIIPGGAGTTAPTLTKEQLARRGGAGAAALLLVMGVGLGGEEWQPRRDEKSGLDEKAMLECAFGDYFVANNMADLPPGWALTAAIGMYALPRFGMPKTQSRLAKVKNWIGAKIVQWKARRRGLKVNVSTQSEADLVQDELDHRADKSHARG